MLKKTLLLTATTLLLLLQGCSSDTPQEEAAALNSMISSNEYTLRDLKDQNYTVVKEGENFVLKEHQGKVVIYDIFATWCPPCRAEAPHLASLQRKYADDLLILGMTIEEDMTDAKLQDYRETYGADYTLTHSKDNIKLSRIIASAINVGQQFPIPLMVMYKDGKYVTHYVGAIPEEMIESDIQQALER